MQIIRKALRVNRSPVQLDISKYLSKKKNEDNNSSVGLLDLFRTPNLRKKTLNICLAWFANSLAYYGLSLGTGSLKGNPFVLLFLMGLVEFPGYVAIVYLLDKLGRRTPTSSCMIAGGLCCIASALMIPGSALATTTVMFGKFFIATSFAIVYNYSAELFPTIVRNSALGLGSMCARLSGTMTPMITLLDKFDHTLPAVVFAIIALISGLLVMYLPETMNASMPQSIEDGEKFGVGDTCFTSCFGKEQKSKTKEDDEHMDEKEPLRTMKPYKL